MNSGEPTKASRTESIFVLVLSCGSLAVYLLTNTTFHREAGEILDSLRKLGERLIW